MRVDPGKHTVVGRLDGEVVFRKEVKLAASADEKVVVTRQRLKKARVAPSNKAKKLGTTPYLLAGLSAVSIGASLGFFALSKRAGDDLDTLCPAGGSCPPRAASTEDRGKTMSAPRHRDVGSWRHWARCQYLLDF